DPPLAERLQPDLAAHYADFAVSVAACQSQIGSACSPSGGGDPPLAERLQPDLAAHYADFAVSVAACQSQIGS
ncbi:hypothetical protein CKJ90_32385, partial [Klebsiella pneumoniae]